MHIALRAESALAYLRELSPAVASAALLHGGELVAGDRALAGLAAPAAEPGPDVVVARDDEGVLVARLGPGGLPGLARVDAALALGAVRGGC